MSVLTKMQLVHVKATDSHFGCLLCGKSNPMSMHLDFYADLTGTVYAEFITNPYLQGYKGILHGGVTCALLDSAMTHCLFNLQIEGVTGTDKQQNNFKGCARKEIRPFISKKSYMHRHRQSLCEHKTITDGPDHTTNRTVPSDYPPFIKQCRYSFVLSAAILLLDSLSALNRL